MFSICLLAAADAGLFMRCNIICNVYRRQRKTTAAIELDIIYKHFQLMPIFLFFLFFFYDSLYSRSIGDAGWEIFLFSNSNSLATICHIDR